MHGGGGQSTGVFFSVLKFHCRGHPPTWLNWCFSTSFEALMNGIVSLISQLVHCGCILKHFTFKVDFYILLHCWIHLSALKVFGRVFRKSSMCRTVLSAKIIWLPFPLVSLLQLNFKNYIQWVVRVAPSLLCSSPVPTRIGHLCFGCHREMLLSPRVVFMLFSLCGLHTF